MDELVKHADLALYGAKAEGRANYRYFEPEMNARMKQRRGLEIDLRLGAGERRVRTALPAARQPADRQPSPAARRCCAGIIRNAA